MFATAIGYLVVGGLAGWFVHHCWNYYYKIPAAKEVHTFSQLVKSVGKSFDQARDSIFIRVRTWPDELYFHPVVFTALQAAIDRNIKVTIHIVGEPTPDWAYYDNSLANLLADWIKYKQITFIGQQSGDNGKWLTFGNYIMVDQVNNWVEHRPITPDKKGKYVLHVFAAKQQDAYSAV